MRRVLTRLSLLFLLVVTASYSLYAVDFYDDAKNETIADAILSGMSNEQILAQTFMLGWVGAEPSPLILRWIRERGLGGVKIFGWNTEDTLKLAATVGTLQQAAMENKDAIPLLVATDQEGGWIRHVKGSTSETPGNMAIGASGFPRDAYLSGYYIGKELALLGINMNFAPTVDLFTNRDSVLIGPRAFGDDPVLAGIMGAAFAKGLEEAGIIATAKHYPGHGDTELDSHGVLPTIDAPFEILWERELIPYRMMARERIPAVMSGHLAFPNTPSGSMPASLSSWFIQEILRERIRYQGLVITDDLLMNGASMPAGGLSKAARLALEAGNDIIMLSKTPLLNDAVWTQLIEAMQNEPAFYSRVRDAARKVLLLKLEFLKRPAAPPLYPDAEAVQTQLPDPEARDFFLDLAARSVTVFSKDSDDSAAVDWIPLDQERTGNIVLAGPLTDFFEAGLTAYPEAERFRFSYTNEGTLASERRALLRSTQDADTVIFCLANAYGLEVLESLKDSGKRVIVISVLSPVYLEQVPWTLGSLAVYSYTKESFLAAFSVLAGNIDARGKLPFTIQDTQP